MNIPIDTPLLCGEVILFWQEFCIIIHIYANKATQCEQRLP
jgi:hypothetical protein